MTYFVNRALVLFGVIFSQGARGDLLACLGREELSIHRSRDGGPVYHLNRFWVNRMALGSKPILRGAYQGKICGPKVPSPSVALLERLLLEGDRIFSGSMDSVPSDKEALEAFFAFLLKIQERAPDHLCLEKNLPHYSHFIHRHKYLEEEGLTLLMEKDKLDAMFRVLERPDALLAKCRKSR